MESVVAALPRRFTRAQVAKHFGVSVTTVRYLEWTGKLHPVFEPGTTDRGPRWTFDPEEVKSLAYEPDRKRTGRRRKRPDRETPQMRSRVMTMLEAGSTVADIVRETGASESLIVRCVELRRMKTGDALVQSVASEKQALAMKEERLRLERVEARRRREHIQFMASKG